MYIYFQTVFIIYVNNVFFSLYILQIEYCFHPNKIFTNRMSYYKVFFLIKILYCTRGDFFRQLPTIL